MGDLIFGVPALPIGWSCQPVLPDPREPIKKSHTQGPADNILHANRNRSDNKVQTVRSALVKKAREKAEALLECAGTEVIPKIGKGTLPGRPSLQKAPTPITSAETSPVNFPENHAHEGDNDTLMTDAPEPESFEAPKPGSLIPIEKNIKTKEILSELKKNPQGVFIAAQNQQDNKTNPRAQDLLQTLLDNKEISGFKKVSPQLFDKNILNNIHHYHDFYRVTFENETTAILSELFIHEPNNLQAASNALDEAYLRHLSYQYQQHNETIKNKDRSLEEIAALNQAMDINLPYIVGADWLKPSTPKPIKQKSTLDCAFAAIVSLWEAFKNSVVYSQKPSLEIFLEQQKNNAETFTRKIFDIAKLKDKNAETKEFTLSRTDFFNYLDTMEEQNQGVFKARLGLNGDKWKEDAWGILIANAFRISEFNGSNEADKKENSKIFGENFKNEYYPDNRTDAPSPQNVEIINLTNELVYAYAGVLAPTELRDFLNSQWAPLPEQAESQGFKPEGFEFKYLELKQNLMPTEEELISPLMEYAKANNTHADIRLIALGAAGYNAKNTKLDHMGHFITLALHEEKWLILDSFKDEAIPLCNKGELIETLQNNGMHNLVYLDQKEQGTSA